MKRWHEEVALMFKRRELRRHDVRGTAIDGIHEQGLTFWRKRHPRDCGNPRCGLCHSEKRWPSSRARARREALAFEQRAFTADDCLQSSPESDSPGVAGTGVQRPT